MERIKLIAAVVHPNGFFLEVADQNADFWIFFGEKAGWGKFSELPNRQGIFELTEVLSARSQVPNPVVSAKGVLWSRREAILAEQRIQIYLEDLEKIGQ